MHGITVKKKSNSFVWVMLAMAPGVSVVIPQVLHRSFSFVTTNTTIANTIIFWGRSSNVSKLFILQKRIIRIINNTGVRESCREALKNMEIMTLCSQYIFSLTLRLLMSYIYGAPILDVSRSHTTTHHSR